MLNDFIYSSIFKNLSTSIIIINDNHDILQINSCAENLLARLQLTMQEFLNLLKEKLDYLYKNNIQEHSFEKCFNTSQKKLYLKFKLNNFFNLRDKSNIISIIIEDISNEIELETVLQAFPDIFFRLDKSGTFLDCRTQQVDELLLPAKEFIGKNIDEVNLNSAGLKLKSTIIKALNTKSIILTEGEFSLKNKQEYYELRVVPISDDEVIALVRNITDKKNSDEELLKLEKLNSIGTLAGGVAHDFNNMLTIILGNISLLKTDVNPKDKISKKLSNLERAVYQAKALTKQLLTFAKGNSPLKKVTYINDLIRESATLSLSGSNVACKMYIPKDLWPVEIDIGQISQVINNLVINSYQSMPNGGVITIRCKNIKLMDNEIISLPAGKYVSMAIKDQGCGISKDNLLKIFDPYFTTKETGSGLGLASAYSIVKKHNGHIIVKSKVSKGSIFQIYLPACDAVPLEIEEVTSHIVYGNHKILVMDDEVDIRNILQDMLNYLGYKVELSSDGLSALGLYKKALLSGDPFDAVIMDLTIPGGMGGEETIKHLLKLDPKVKAIVSSGYSSGDVISSFRDYGFKGAINKPYTIEELSNELSRVLLVK